MNIPYVYTDSWHIGMPMFSPRCVIVPALVRNKLDNRYLSLAEQAELYWSLPDDGHESFPTDFYEARNATGDEILEAVKEALMLGSDAAPKRSPLQEEVAKIDRRGLLPYTQARFGRHFLDKHRNLIHISADQSLHHDS